MITLTSTGPVRAFPVMARMLPSGAVPLERWLAEMPRTLLVCVTAAIASQAAPLSSMLGILPAYPDSSRSPSSDVMAQALPLPRAGEALAAFARRLPPGPGVVIAHGPVSAAVAPYYVIATHLWPRPIMLVSCEPAPIRHHAFSRDETRPVAWRLDVRPGAAAPIRMTDARDALRPDGWCRTDSP